MKKRLKIHDNWQTPPDILAQAIGKYSEFYDPCPLNADFNGLECEWHAVNYVNPPYERKLKEAFIRKAYEESQKGKICIMLLPVSTSTKIFHEIILPNAKIHFLKGRVKFIGINSKGEKVYNKCGQHDSMLVTFNGNAEPGRK